MEKLIKIILVILSINSLIAQPCLPDGITFSSQSQLDSFKESYPNCTEIQGHVVIEGNDIKDLNGLSSITSMGNLQIKLNDSLKTVAGLYNLTTIENSLLIYNNPILQELTGLRNLDSIGYSLSIIGNLLLNNLAGFSKLTTIDGYLWIEDNLVLQELIGLHNIRTIGNHLTIDGNNTLNDLFGLNKLVTVGDYLSISYNFSLQDLTGLDSLSTIGGGLSIKNNYALKNITNLSNLVSIGERIEIMSNDSLVNLIGLDNISSIPGWLTIRTNKSLETLTGLEMVDSIGEVLQIVGNPKLESIANLSNLEHLSELYISYTRIENLNGLESLTTLNGGIGGIMLNSNNNLTNIEGLINVTSLHGSINIYYNERLKSLSGLDNINAESIFNLNISNNDSLSVCHVNSICDYISNPNGELNIYSNYQTCQDQNEVEEACKLVHFDNFFVYNSITISPNPAKTIINISSPLPISKLTLYDLFGRKKQNSITKNNMMNVSQVNGGVYILEIETKKNLIRKKVIIK